jgi:RimJ/RimL family protein N-acetyltransferase
MRSHALDLQPTLTGILLELRPLQPADFASLFAVASDPLIWEQHPDRDRYREPVFKEFFREALESGGALVAVHRATGALIGSSRYHGHDAAAREVEIGWSFLGRAYWGGRYNGDMKRLMLDHAFRWVDRVVFVIGPENHRSQRSVAKIGAVPIDPRRDGRGRERLVFALTPAQWAPHRARLVASLGSIP